MLSKIQEQHAVYSYLFTDKFKTKSFTVWQYILMVELNHLYAILISQRIILSLPADKVLVSSLK